MKRFVNLLLGGALVMAFAASCEPTGTSNTEKPVLVATPESIDATGEDITTFTVLYGEEDVTAESRIFLAKDNSELINKNFSTTIPGDYEFYATYNNISSDFIKVTAKGDATLTVDKGMIAADGTDMATFTVTQDGVDVTSESILYLIPEEGEPIAQEGFTFSTTEIGVYNFYAQKGTASTNRISVTALTKDAQPESFNFKHRGLITEFTGTWCGWCAIMKAGIHNLEENGFDAGFAVEIHSSDSMTLPYQGTLFSQFGAGSTGLPTMTFQLDKKTKIVGAYSSSSIEANSNRISQIMEDCLKEYECTSGVSGTYYIDEEGNLHVIAGVKIAEDGEYRIAAWLCENNIYEEQANYTAGVVNTEDVSTHNNVLRDVSNSSQFTGDDITIGAGEVQGFEWTFDTSSLINDDTPENSHVLIFVTKKQDGDVYVVNNIIRCELGETVEFEYAE